MPLNITGTDYLQMTAHASAKNGGSTFLVVHKRSTDSIASRAYVMNLNQGAGDQGGGMLYEFTSNKLASYNEAVIVAASTLTVTTTDGWVCWAVTKAAGSATPRFHKYVYSTGVSSHENGTTTQADGTAVGASGKVNFAKERVADSTFAVGSYAVAAMYDRVLSDQEFESAAQSVANMKSLGPNWGLWLFDGAVNTADESFIGSVYSAGTATSVDGGGSPVGMGFAVQDDPGNPGAPQTLSPTALATAEAFGTAVISSALTVSPGAIATAEAFGTVVVSTAVTLSPSAIATAQAFGTATLSSSVTLSPSAIASLEAFGTASLGGSATVSPSSIDTAESFGTLSLSRAQFFDGPTYSIPMGPNGEWLFRRMRLEVAKCVLITDGIVTVVAYPTDEQIQAADTVLRGGSTHAISTDDADILIAAGLSAYIHGA